MSVFVDKPRPWVTKGGVVVRCHMWSNGSEDELHAIAEKLGLTKAGYQKRPELRKCHYDLPEAKRLRAIELGAIPMEYRVFYKLFLNLGLAAALAISGPHGRWDYRMPQTLVSLFQPASGPATLVLRNADGSCSISVGGVVLYPDVPETACLG